LRTIAARAEDHAVHMADIDWGIIVSGEGACGFLDCEHEVGPGSLGLVLPGIPHWFRNISGTPLTMVGGYLGVGSLDEAGCEFVSPLTDAMRQVPHR
jgi:mannose-6-phosphate isomerase-like protein (cupin superfamily)